jgi:hypothetical protein
MSRLGWQDRSRTIDGEVNVDEIRRSIDQVDDCGEPTER